MKKRVLVDGFYAAYRSFYAFKDIKTKDGRGAGLIFGFVRTLTFLAKRFPGAEIIICWDSPSTWRKAEFPAYKGNRSHTQKADTKQLYSAADYVRAVGLAQAVVAGQEADDVIGSLIDRTKLNIIFSRDRDFCQLVEDGVVEVYSPKSGDVPEVVYTEAVVKERFGVSPRKLLHYRVLKGDTSDNLPGLPRFPSKKIIELVDTHDTIEEIVTSPRAQLTEHQTKALTDFQEQSRINLRLMRIRTDLEVQIIEGQYNRARAEQILDEFELKSLRTSITLFLEGEEEPSLFA
jgi:5'-3' exonuclease